MQAGVNSPWATCALLRVLMNGRDYRQTAMTFVAGTGLVF